MVKAPEGEVKRVDVGHWHFKVAEHCFYLYIYHTVSTSM